MLLSLSTFFLECQIPVTHDGSRWADNKVFQPEAGMRGTVGTAPCACSSQYPSFPLLVVNVHQVLFVIFFGEPEGLFFRVDASLGLGFGEVFKELADDGAGFEFEAAHEFRGADELGRQDTVSLADVAGEQETDDGEVACPVFVERLRAEGGEMVGQREDGDEDAIAVKIDEVAANGSWRDRADLPKLAGPHMMHRHLLDEALVGGAGAQPPENLLRQRHADLGMSVEMDGSLFVDAIRGRFADIVQQGGQLQAWRREHRELENALLFRLMQQGGNFRKMALPFQWGAANDFRFLL